MKFDTPATSNPIDQLKIVGQPVDRIDGPRKTTGTAPYAYERHDVARNQAYGHVLGAGIAKGRITAMDTAAAKAAPGVLAIVTTLDMPQLEKGKTNTASLFGGAEIQHYHQAIAVVVAETFEQARDAAAMIRVDYARQPGRFDLAAEAPKAKLAAADSGEGSRAAGGSRRRLRGRLRPGRRHAGRDLYDAGREPCDDGAACDHRRLGGREAYRLDLQPDDRLGQARPGDDARDCRRRTCGWTAPSSAAASAASCSSGRMRCWRHWAPRPRGGR